jgi:hypothetical protein
MGRSISLRTFPNGSSYHLYVCFLTLVLWPLFQILTNRRRLSTPISTKLQSISGPEGPDRSLPTHQCAKRNLSRFLSSAQITDPKEKSDAKMAVHTFWTYAPHHSRRYDHAHTYVFVRLRPSLYQTKCRTSNGHTTPRTY